MQRPALTPSLPVPAAGSRMWAGLSSRRVSSASGSATRLLRLVWAAVALSMLVVCGSLLHHAPSHADAPVVATNRATPNAVWQALTPLQKQVLAPLHEHWSAMDDTSRDKWLGVAERYPKLSAAEQARVRERMAQWSRIPANERGEARLRFQQSRQMSPDERQKKWDAYQALPKEDRADLQRQAARRAKPVFLADGTPGPREAKQAFAVKRNAGNAQTERKTNLVPTPNGNANSAAIVAPTVVKAGAGATTTLVTQRPTPPLHQQSGLPKIAATKGFVDPVTMLPKRGAQSVGMAAASTVGTASANPH